MASNSSQFVGDIPEHYDAALGPNIFLGHAEDIVSRAAKLPASQTLELAAGTGIVSRLLRDALPPTTTLTVTDLNPPMLAVAARKFRPDELVRFQTADAMQLPFDDHAFDLVVCQFGVMFFSDKPASFRETRRVLRNGGCYLLSAWGTLADNPFARIAHEAVLECFPNNPPGFYQTPFSYADAQTALGDLRAAGFSSVIHEIVRLTRAVQDLQAFARGLVFGNPLIDEIRQRGGVHPDDVASNIERRLRAAWGAEPVTMPLLAHIYCATA